MFWHLNTVQNNQCRKSSNHLSLHKVITVVLLITIIPMLYFISHDYLVIMYLLIPFTYFLWSVLNNILQFFFFLMLYEGDIQRSVSIFNLLSLFLKVNVKVVQSWPVLYNPIEYSPPGFAVHRILQARLLEWVAIPFSRGSSWPRDWTRVSHIAGRVFNVWATREAHWELYHYRQLQKKYF